MHNSVWFKSPIFADVMRFFVCLVLMMVYLVVICFWSDEVTIKFGRLNESICECSWYELPMETQRLLPIMLMNIQRPVNMKGYMNVRCTRESVKLVIIHHIKHNWWKIKFSHFLFVSWKQDNQCCCFLFYGVARVQWLNYCHMKWIKLSMKSLIGFWKRNFYLHLKLKHW